MELKVASMPKHYHIVTADLSLRRPGFCRVKIKRDENGKTVIESASVSSIDLKKEKATHGE